MQAVADGIGWVIGLVPGLDGSAASGSVAFLIDASSTPPRLSTIGWIVASALVAALLIWLNQLMQKQTERSIVWDRCPLDVRTWLVLTAIPRAIYVLGAAVVVWFAILDWWEPQPDTAWLVVAAVLVAIVAAFVIVEPRFSPAPRVVPEQETLDGRATVLPADRADAPRRRHRERRLPARTRRATREPRARGRMGDLVGEALPRVAAERVAESRYEPGCSGPRSDWTVGRTTPAGSPPVTSSTNASMSRNGRSETRCSAMSGASTAPE